MPGRRSQVQVAQDQPAHQLHAVEEGREPGDDPHRLRHLGQREERAAEEEKRVDDEAKDPREAHVVALPGGEGDQPAREAQAGESNHGDR